jgi:DNA gyrase inhibitor GyrI
MTPSTTRASDVPAKPNITSDLEFITLQPSFLVYLEKLGPFSKTAPLAWKEFWSIAAGQLGQGKNSSMVGLSWIDETKAGDAAFIYQAGVLLVEKPDRIPNGLQVRLLKEGKYARFLLTGAYSQLPIAYPFAFSILEKENVAVRKDFCLEKYLNSMDTPEENLKTEILIPVL